MKKLICFLVALYFFSSAVQAQENEQHYFRVLFNGFVVNYNSEVGKYLNYIYSGKYIEKSEINHISLDTCLKDDDYIADHICLIFSSMIYIISYNESTEEDGWNVVTKARITKINFPGTPQEKREKLILATGKIKFDPKIDMILFIKTTVKEDESKKI